MKHSSNGKKFCKDVIVETMEKHGITCMQLYKLYSNLWKKLQKYDARKL